MTAEELIVASEAELAENFKKADEISELNQEKVLKAFNEHQIAIRHFNGTTGYGYGDDGRDKLDAVFAQILGTEDALVRHNFVNGTCANCKASEITIIASGTCGVCLNAIETAHLAPILVSKGYSICTFNDKYAFANGFEVYHDSLYAYEQVYGRLELGILFALNDKYQSVDLYSNIGSMGIAMTFVTAEEDNFQYESFDFIMYYSKGIEITNANGIPRGEEQIVIAAYAKETNGTIHYVQDDDHLCMAGNTSDGKYATVSYRSIYGYIETQGLL